MGYGIKEIDGCEAVKELLVEVIDSFPVGTCMSKDELVRYALAYALMRMNIENTYEALVVYMGIKHVVDNL